MAKNFNIMTKNYNITQKILHQIDWYKSIQVSFVFVIKSQYGIFKDVDCENSLLGLGNGSVSTRCLHLLPEHSHSFKILKNIIRSWRLQHKLSSFYCTDESSFITF